MRKIKYKAKDSVEFLNFIDIGTCERDYYHINLFLQGKQENKSGKQYKEHSIVHGYHSATLHSNHEQYQ
jgi:hypothetical protein